MSLNIGDNFSYLGKKFLDNRQSFDTLELMNNCSDVPIGFITFCKEDNKRYEYTESGWVEYSTSISNEQVEKIDAAYIHSQTQHVQPSDLEEYVTDEELNNKGYLTNIPEEYVTETELNAKGYLTKHQDLSGYVSKEELEESLTNKFDNVEVNETESNDTQTALDFYANGEVVKTVYFTGGGGGNVNTPPYVTLLSAENNILGLGEVFNLELDFLSGVTGKGTLKVFINDIEVVSKSIPQGENTIPITDDNFIKGSNRMTLYVIDRTGTMSNSVTLYVRYGSLEIASDFDVYTAYEPGAVVRYYFTPNAVDTSLALTMYMKIDGEVKPGVSCQSDTRGYYTFPNNLNVGSHYCQAYIIDSAGNTSNILAFNLIILDDTSLIVASDTINPSIEEGEQLSLDYKVYMKNNNSFITKIYIDDDLVNTGTCGLDFAYYRTSNLTEGIHTVKLEVYNTTETVSDYIIWTVTITPSTYQMLEPVNAGALFIGTSQNMTNSSEGKEIWKGKDQDGNIVNGILNNFAFNSESGWVDNELLITGASSVEIPITPLANNARYGFTLDIEFASKMIGIEDALVLNLWDEEKDCGIKITTEKVILRSAEGNQADLYFTDGEMTSVIFVIDRNELKAKIYLNGVMCRAFHLSDYSIDGVPYLEDFTVNNTIMLGGSGHARIKNLRVYQVALTTDEILNNFMANERNKNKQKELVEFQKGNHLPTLTIYCDFSGLGKDDKKPCSITYVSTDEEKYGKSFTLSHKESTCQYQGTSSMAYPIKNYRINLADDKGEKWKYDFPYGKPEHRFTLKADFMSSGHWTNTGLTKWINNNLYNYDLDDEKTMNPKKWHDINNGGSIDDTRECIYGFPCRLILINDGKTPLNEGQNEPTPGNTKDMGIFNFNHDKDATDTMGFDDDVFPNCASYEVTANSDTSAGAFMSYTTVNPSDMSELDYIKQSFELRFPDEEDVPEGWGFMGVGEEGTGLKALIDWVDNCTDEEFVRDFDQHFHRDYTLRYFLLVITLGMVDNLGKNMMLDTWDNKIFMPRFYDCDTICSYDNSGQLKFAVDIEMAQGYWNTSSSRLWTRIRDLMHDELVEKYNNMRQNGLSYESLMECFYDEQIAKIPQKYYNMDYDVKYAPFADSYIGMANGDTYEHLKRWLQQRLRFVDTLYDYAPSYNNDVLTIRANTTEPMTLEIETYTPVYQHLSWYNNQMDKKKIDGKTSVTFTGKAMAETDQEVLIYGGSNIKSIKGITSMNPNRMLIGSATKLIELDAPNCPLLADINANKANLAPHVYLNKVNLSGCPLLGGNLIINQSPLVREIDIHNTSIIGLNLPTNLRNLEVLKLPSAIKTLTLNDASQLHTLEFDEGVAVQNVTMTNCNALTNITNFNLEDATNVILNNSYDTVNELYLSKTTNLSVSNMPNLERIIYTPNAEHEIFDKTNVDNALNYTISTFNCPKLNTFITTAPYRESYGKEYGEVKPNEVFEANSIDISNTQFTDVKLLCTTDTNVLKLPQTVKKLIVDSAYDLDTAYLTDGNYNTIHTNLYEPYNTDYEEEVLLNGKTPNLIPSASDGSIIQSMYVPTKTVQPTSGVWDFKGLELEEYHTFGLNNDVKLVDNTLTMPERYDEYSLSIKNKQMANEVARYTASDWYTFPAFNSEFTYTYNIIQLNDGVYEYSIIANSADNLPTSISFDGKSSLLTVEYLNISNVTNMGYMFQNCNNLTSLDVSNWDTSKVTSMNNMFYNCNNLTDLDVSNFNTSNVIYMESMFSGCSALTTIGDVSRWVASKVTNMGAMFEGCKKLTSLDLSNWNTSNVTTMFGMFRGCNNLTSLDLSNFNTSEVTSMAEMFQNCNSLTSITLGNNFNTNNVTNMLSMFSNCKKLTELDVSNWDTSKVTIMEGMFQNCNNLEPLDVSNFDTSKVTTMYNMFEGCSKLTELDVSNFDTREVTNMASMFSYCNNLTSLNVSNFNTSKVTNMGYMFNNCSKLTSLDVSNFNTSKVTNMQYMFQNCTSLQELHIESWELNTTTQAGVSTLPIGDDAKNEIYTSAYFTVPNGWTLYNALEIARYTTNTSGVLPTFNNGYSGYSTQELENEGIYTVKIATNSMDNLPTQINFNGKNNLLTVEYLNTSNVTNMYQMFYNCSNLTNLDLNSFNTSKVTNMSGMFYGCSKLTSLDLNSFNTSEVTDMQGMFNSCNSLTSLDLSNFNTSNVIIMQDMFASCTNLTSLNLSSFNTSNVTNMTQMFYSCSSLTSLDLSSFNTSKIDNMNNMFYNCKKLTSLDVSKFDTKNVTNMSQMFCDCQLLTSLNLSSFDTSKVTNMSTMFYNCTKLASLNLSNFNTAIVTNMNNMFYNCSNLTNLDLSNFNTSKVTNMGNMFHNCNNLTSLNVSSFDTSEVTDMSSMFNNCTILTSLDLSNFDTSNVTNMESMFQNCTSLQKLHIESWVLNDITQAGVSSLPTGDDEKNMVYAGAYFTVPSGWKLKYNNPYDIAIYTCNASGVLPYFNDKYTGYTVEEIDNGDGTYTTYIRTNDLDVLPTQISFNNEYSLLNVEKLNVNNVTIMRGMFQQCSKLTSLDASNWDTSKVTDMSYMFNGCIKLTELDVSNWNTSKVPDMYNMFYNCQSLTSLDVSNWGTSNVTSMNGTFAGCSKLTSLDVSNWNTSKVTNMKNMFSSCSKLTSLDLSNFDTSKVTTMENMFSGCSGLTSLDLSNFETPEVTTMTYMFYSCSNLTSLDLSSFDTSKVTNMNRMFGSCSKLTSLDVSNFNTSSVKNMNQMFGSSFRLTTLDLSNFDTSSVTDMGYMFFSCSQLTSLDLSSFNTSKVTNMSSMFSSCGSLKTLNVEGWPLNDATQTAISTLPAGNGIDNLIYATVNFTIPTGWKLKYNNPYDIAIYTCNTSGVVPTFNSGYTGYTKEETNNGDGTYTTHIRTNDLDVMPTQISFSGKSSLLSVEKLKVTSSVTNMSNMFKNCDKLTSLNVSGWNTSSVTNMSNMFYYCNNLTSLDLSGWNTSSVTNMSNMFYYCNKLTSLDLSGWNTSNVTNMYNMFFNCNKLTSLDLSSFDTSKVVGTGSFNSMVNMFSSCISLASLNSMTNISTALSLSDTILDTVSLLDVINNLATLTTTQTLTLGSTLLAKLTEEQIAVAVNKGWTVV